MPHFYNHFPANLQEWALEQPLFFTATAPARGHHINCSPKGLTSSTFTVFDENSAGYLDATGSGVETIAHLYDNGRITVMFCSFTAKPRILRLFCTGRVVESHNPRFPEVVRRMGKEPRELIHGIRAIILLDIWKVQTACGYAVPTSQEPSCGAVSDQPSWGTDSGEKRSLYDPVSFQDRETLTKWLENKVRKSALDEYKMKNNARSLDDLPALRSARKLRKEYLLLGDAHAWAKRELDHFWALCLGTVIGILLVTLAMMLDPTTSG